jgi:hypothetical protein
MVKSKKLTKAQVRILGELSDTEFEFRSERQSIPLSTLSLRGLVETKHGLYKSSGGLHEFRLMYRRTESGRQLAEASNAAEVC